LQSVSKSTVIVEPFELEIVLEIRDHGALENLRGLRRSLKGIELNICSSANRVMEKFRESFRVGPGGGGLSASPQHSAGPKGLSNREPPTEPPSVPRGPS
jgi:hypothetical protein